MTRTPLARHLVAAAVVLLTFCAKEPIERLVGPGPPLIFFVPAVTLSAWQGGLGPGLLATALAAALCSFHFFPPTGSLAVSSPNDVARIVAFVSEGVLTSVLMEWLLRARRQAEDSQRRAVEAERLAAIGQMAAGLAHEGRNALQRGQACLEMLARQVEDRPVALDLVAGIQEAQDDLHRLYEEVRDYAAPIILDRQHCRISDLLRDAWGRLAPTRAGRDVSLKDRGDPDLACFGDAFRLIQVLRNILDNALAAAHDPVVIEVEWSAADTAKQRVVGIVIRDNGPGLTPEQTCSLFQPFYTTKTHGTGLGMAIAKRIIDAHEGVIAAGAADGCGATILITLPRGQP